MQSIAFGDEGNCRDCMLALHIWNLPCSEGLVQCKALHSPVARTEPNNTICMKHPRQS